MTILLYGNPSGCPSKEDLVAAVLQKVAVNLAVGVVLGSHTYAMAPAVALSVVSLADSLATAIDKDDEASWRNFAFAAVGTMGLTGRWIKLLPAASLYANIAIAGVGNYKNFQESGDATDWTGLASWLAVVGSSKSAPVVLK